MLSHIYILCSSRCRVHTIVALLICEDRRTVNGDPREWGEREKEKRGNFLISLTSRMLQYKFFFQVHVTYLQLLINLLLDRSAHRCRVDSHYSLGQPIGKTHLQRILERRLRGLITLASVMRLTTTDDIETHHRSSVAHYLHDSLDFPSSDTIGHSTNQRQTIATAAVHILHTPARESTRSQTRPSLSLPLSHTHIEQPTRGYIRNGSPLHGWERGGGKN